MASMFLKGTFAPGMLATSISPPSGHRITLITSLICRQMSSGSTKALTHAWRQMPLALATINSEV